MSLRLPVQAFRTAFPTLNVVSGGSLDWDHQCDLDLGSMWRLSDYKTGNSKKMHKDNYFYDWLSMVYEKEGKTIEETHNVWRYGVPGRFSAIKNCARYCTPLSPPDVNLVPLCQDWCARKFRFMGDSSIDWSFDYVRAQLNLNSSPGFPYTRPYKGNPAFSTKRKLFETKLSFAKEEYQEYLDRLSLLEFSSCEPYTLSPKSELRKISKIEKDDFRAYTAANWRNTCAGIGACGDMCAKFYDSWAHSPAFVGGSTFNSCWDVLFKRLSKHPNAAECDETAWDATIHSVWIEALREVMWGFVKPSQQSAVNKLRFSNLFKEISHSLIVCPNGDLFWKEQGNPSGSFLTIVTNTLILYMIFCYAWLKLAPEELQDFDSFDRNVELALCGDDNLFTVSDCCKGFFNVEAIVTIWKEMGIIAKREAMSEGPLYERKFLSQRTRLLKGTAVPYPDYDKVISSMIWHTNAHHGVKWSYIKACSLRITSYMEPRCRDLFDSYIKYMERVYVNELKAEPSKTATKIDFHWDVLSKMYKTDMELMALYIYTEGKGPVVESSVPLSLGKCVTDSLKLEELTIFDKNVNCVTRRFVQFLDTGIGPVFLPEAFPFGLSGLNCNDC